MLKHRQGAQYSNGQPWPDPTAKEEGLFDKQQPGGFLHLFAIFRILSLPIFQIDSQDEIFSPLPSSSKGRAASLSRATFPPPRISELSRFTTSPIIVARVLAVTPSRALAAPGREVRRGPIRIRSRPPLGMDLLPRAHWTAQGSKLLLAGASRLSWLPSLPRCPCCSPLQLHSEDQDPHHAVIRSWALVPDRDPPQSSESAGNRGPNHWGSAAART